MLVFLSKLLPLFAYPLGLACLMLVAVIIIHNKSTWRNILLIAILVVLWLGGNRWVAYSLARTLEWRYLTTGELPAAQVIVLLGGATEPGLYPRPGVELNSAADRIFYAAQLYRQGKASHILVSGGYIPWLEGEQSSPASEMAQILSVLGVPDRAIWLEERSLNTYENALFCWQFLQEKKINKIMLVTSAMHMPRAVALFEKQGFQVIPAPADFTVTQTGWDKLFSGNIQSFILNLIPNASSLALTTQVLKEYFGLLFYQLQGLI